MSFILDALRKSETERQRQSGPGLIDAGYRPPASRRAVWLPILVVVLLANLAVMAFLWLRRPAAAPEAAQSVPAPAAASAAATPAQAPPPAPTTPAAAVAAADSEAAYAATADMPAIEARGGAATEVLEPPPGDVAPGGAGVAPAATGVIQEGLPTADELIASGAISVPAMHLDIHVFTPDPAGRFVFINMRKYTEGAVLTEGPRLDEITREGAVLSQAGRRFVLNRD